VRAAADEVTVVVRDVGSWRERRGSGRGRGLGIIESVMDAVEVNKHPVGTEVVMRRRLARS
jgi:anti-sigma regulatory factor (Ser/Thr protein kinase)